MTPQEIQDLCRVFSDEPAFEFLSPEGTVGYPEELLNLDVRDIQQMIARSEDYAREVKALADLPAEPVTCD
jgi:hypothetical protein